MVLYSITYVYNYVQLSSHHGRLLVNEQHIERKSKGQYQQDGEVDEFDEVEVDVKEHGDALSYVGHALQNEDAVQPPQKHC